MNESAPLTGIDRLARGHAKLPLTERYALLTNRAARAGDGSWSYDILRHVGADVRVLLTSEHGLEATHAAGEPIPHDHSGPIPLLSMYGADWEIVRAAISSVDSVLVDLPDVGCRYYTYGWTVREVLKLAAEFGRGVTVLDRPNPLGGMQVEGNLPEPGRDSAVCASRVVVRHGLTIGELALWQMHDLDLAIDLRIEPVTGWSRRMIMRPDDARWVPPSPALIRAEAALVYPGTCLLEGTNISEGRGSDAPFVQFGAPFIDPDALLYALADEEYLAGARLSAIAFTPTGSKWSGTRCHGARVEVVDAERFQPVRAGIAIVAALRHFDGFRFTAHFDALAGTAVWRERLEAGAAAADVVGDWSRNEAQFAAERAEVLLYD